MQKDKGRLNVVQSRAKVPAPAVTSSEALVNTQLPLTEGKKEKRRVVYSVPIPAPLKGEVLAFDASFGSDISGLRFNTFIGSRVLMAHRPDRHHLRGDREDARSRSAARRPSPTGSTAPSGPAASPTRARR